MVGWISERSGWGEGLLDYETECGVGGFETDGKGDGASGLWALISKRTGVVAPWTVLRTCTGRFLTGRGSARGCLVVEVLMVDFAKRTCGVGRLRSPLC